MKFMILAILFWQPLAIFGIFFRDNLRGQEIPTPGTTPSTCVSIIVQRFVLCTIIKIHLCLKSIDFTIISFTPEVTSLFFYACPILFFFFFYTASVEDQEVRGLIPGRVIQKSIWHLESRLAHEYVKLHHFSYLQQIH